MSHPVEKLSQKIPKIISAMQDVSGQIKSLTLSMPDGELLSVANPVIVSSDAFSSPDVVTRTLEPEVSHE